MVFDWKFSEENQGITTKKNNDQSVVSHNYRKGTNVSDSEKSKTVSGITKMQDKWRERVVSA